MAADQRPAPDEAGTPADAPAAGDHAARLAALRRLDSICQRAFAMRDARLAAEAATSDDPRAGATSGQDPASSAE